MPRGMFVCLTPFVLLLTPHLFSAEAPTVKAWQILEEGVHNRAADKRVRALRALGVLPESSRAIQILEESLQDERPEVRAAAAGVLGEIKSARSRPKLRALLNDREVDVVLAAANALYALNDPIAFQVYYKVLTGSEKTHDTLSDEARKTLSDPGKIAKLGFEQGIGFVPFGGAGYTAFKMLLKDDASPVRGAAALKLAKDPDPSATKALIEATTDKKATVRAAAVAALAIRKDPSTRKAIEAAMDDQNETVRYNAAAAYLARNKPARSRAPNATKTASQ